LKDLERRLDTARFIKLWRGTLVNIDLIAKVSVMPGGTQMSFLSNGPLTGGQSRLQVKILRELLLRL
jgi:DNA-binding LytR/AlgR family response regulator